MKEKDKCQQFAFIISAKAPTGLVQAMLLVRALSTQSGNEQAFATTRKMQFFNIFSCFANEITEKKAVIVM